MRKIRFILDLTALARVFSDTSAQLDAKPTGERCLYSTARERKTGKNPGSSEGQGPAGENQASGFGLPALGFPV